MATWQHFTVAASELAAFGTERLAGKVAYLATIRADGSPRVHPITPHIAQGCLFVYMDPASPKAHDLQRDSRYALHCSVEDTDGGAGEFSLRGQAQIIDDPNARAALFEAAKAAGFNPQARYVLFELDIETALATIYAGGEPTRKRWKADNDNSWRS